MNDYLISLFLDDELGLDEKHQFVEAVATDADFVEQTMELLEQEKILRSGMAATPAPALRIPVKKRLQFWLPSLRPAFAGFAVALLLVTVVMRLPRDPVQIVRVEEVPHRFILYQPGTDPAYVLGSFTGWSPVPMERIGSSGYWSLDLKLRPGEYRYNYLVGSEQRITDPTVPDREIDDFGGENTVLTIESSSI